MNKNSNLAFTILRFGFALVFVWFAVSQLSNPEKWISFLPDFVKALPISAIAFVKINALFELVSASLLLLGAWTRIAALLLSVHLLGIALSIGWNPTGIRDFGLAIGVLAIAVGGAGSFAIDNKSEMTNLGESGSV
jgi:uncharacterized membrane protein YphA (DoxX/SURF4 family)